MKTGKFERRNQVLLASSSRYFLEGISNVIRAKSADIEVITETFKQKIEKHLAQIKPRFLFLDNRMLNHDIKHLFGLISKKSPNTQVILFKNKNKRVKLDSPKVIYITKKTNSSELIKIIKNNRLGKSRGTVI
jgi:DNA-binding NarL/FixJ family response regulator